jgi:hypothetical protein
MTHGGELTERAFRHLPLDDQIIADFVYRKAREEFPPETGDFAPKLVDCICLAVNELSGRRVISLLPVLAYRRVRCCIRAGTCDCGEC